MLGDAIEAEDWPRALGLALEAWRSTRAPALADLIDAIGARCPQVPPPRRDQHVWWVESAVTYDAVLACTHYAMAHERVVRADGDWTEMQARHPDDPIIARLLAAVRDRATRPGYLANDSLPNHQRNRIERLARFARWPADPRTATVLVKWFVDDTFRWDYPHDTASAVYLDIVGELLIDIADVRTIPKLADCAARPRARTEDLRERQVEIARRVIAAIEGRAQPADPRIAKWTAELAVIRHTVAPRDLRELWRECANDDSDLARTVLADALLEQGDPRGQFIQLQCSGAPGDEARAQSLLALHWKTWFGDLALVARRNACRFERGLLHTISVDAKAPDWAYESTGDHRELLAIDTVWPGFKVPPQAFAAFLAGFERLPRATQLAREILDALVARRPQWPFRSLFVRVEGSLGAWIDALESMTPDLEALQIEFVRYDPASPELIAQIRRRLPKLTRVHVGSDWVMRGLYAEHKEKLRHLAATHPFFTHDKLD